MSINLKILSILATAGLVANSAWADTKNDGYWWNQNNESKDVSSAVNDTSKWYWGKSATGKIVPESVDLTSNYTYFSYGSQDLYVPAGSTFAAKRVWFGTGWGQTTTFTNNGTIETIETAIGYWDDGHAYVVQDSGSWSAGWLYIGITENSSKPNTNGVFVINGGELKVSDYIGIGQDGAASNRLEVAGGTVSSGKIHVGNGGGSFGALTVSGDGVLTTTGNYEILVGEGSSSTGVVEIADTASIEARKFWIGDKSSGTVNVNGSATLASRNDFVIGNDGVGEVTVDGGTLRVGNQLFMPYGAGNGSLTVNGGYVDLSHGDSIMGRTAGGTGTLTVNGGTVSLYMKWLKTKGGTSVINLNGGLFYGSHIDAETPANVTVNFNGGTFGADGNTTYSTDMIPSGINWNIGNNGAIISNDVDMVISATPTIAAGATSAVLYKQGSGTLTLNATDITALTRIVIQGEGPVALKEGRTVPSVEIGEGGNLRYSSVSSLVASPSDITVTAGALTIDKATLENLGAPIKVSGGLLRVDLTEVELTEN